MKFIVTIVLIITFLISTTNFLCAESEFVIAYSHTFRSINIRGNKLHKSWLRQKSNTFESQVPWAYNNVSWSVLINEDEVNKFKQWINDTNIFSLNSEYPPQLPNSRISSHKSELIARLNKKEIIIKWDDSSNCPEIKEAISALYKIVDEIETKYQPKENVSDYLNLGR